MCHDEAASPFGPKQKQRRGYASVEAIDPRDGKIWHVLLPDTKMDYTARRGLGAAMELADTVRWALRHPRSIFRGVREIEKDVVEDDWLCYVSAPGHAYDYKTGAKRAAWPGEVFLVFVTDDRVIFNWYWCEADKRECYLPSDYENRFLEKVL